MTSGKASRKARQAPPPRRTPTSGGQRKASPKVLMAGGAVVAAIIVAIVLGVTLGGGGGNGLEGLPETGSLETNLSGATEIDELFKGIPQDGMTLGQADAPVTVTQFVDLQCPACRAWETTAFTEVIEKWVRTGKAKIDTQAWAFIGEDSFRGRDAVLAASLQDKAYNYMALLYANQGAENAGWLDDDMVGRTAAAIPGLKVQQLLDDRSSQEVKDLGKAVDEKATADGVNSTPTLFVGKSGTKGEQVDLVSLEDPTPVDQAIQALLGEE